MIHPFPLRTATTHLTGNTAKSFDSSWFLCSVEFHNTYILNVKYVAREIKWNRRLLAVTFFPCSPHRSTRHKWKAEAVETSRKDYTSPALTKIVKFENYLIKVYSLKWKWKSPESQKHINPKILRVPHFNLPSLIVSRWSHHLGEQSERNFVHGIPRANEVKRRRSERVNEEPKISGSLCQCDCVSVKSINLSSKLSSYTKTLCCHPTWKREWEGNNNKSRTQLRDMEYIFSSKQARVGRAWMRANRVEWVTTLRRCVCMRKCFHFFLSFFSALVYMLCVLLCSWSANVEQLIQCFILLFFVFFDFIYFTFKLSYYFNFCPHVYISIPPHGLHRKMH